MMGSLVIPDLTRKSVGVGSEYHNSGHD
jgi:hypothetical protein